MNSRQPATPSNGYRNGAAVNPTTAGHRHVLEPSGGGTRLEVVGEAKPKGMLRAFAAGAATKAAESEFRRDFERLKELLEAR